METERSLQRLQVPTTCPYPQSDKYNPSPTIPLPDFHFILRPHLGLSTPSGLFPSGSPPKPCIHLSSPPYLIHDSCMLFFPISSPE